LIGKRYNTEKNSSVGRPKLVASHPIKDDKLSNTTSKIIGLSSGVCESKVKTNEKFALALEAIETKTGVQKYEFLLGNLKSTMQDLCIFLCPIVE